jgi:hypothetical protein
VPGLPEGVVAESRLRRLVAPVVAAGATGVVLFVVGVVVGGGVVYLLHSENVIDDPEDPRPAAFSEVDEQLGGELAARFRPRLKFDSLEAWRPLNISRMLEERAGDRPAHDFCRVEAERPVCNPIEDEADFRRQADQAAALGQSTYIDLAGDVLDEYRGPGRCGTLADCGGGAGSAIYYHVTESNDRYYIDYWWFLRFNNFYRSKPSVSCRIRRLREEHVCGEHEGDWEGVTVVTRPGEDTQLDYVVYAAHAGTFRYAAAQPDSDGPVRPDVYIARGSHASYPTECARDCDQPITIQGLVTLPESNSNGMADWERNEDECEPNAPGSCLLSLPRPDRDPKAWTVWPGRWGEGCGDVCGGQSGPNSPTAPGLQTRYQTPWCSTREGIFTCDGVALRCSDWLGPLVVAVACDPDLLAKGLNEPEAQDVSRLALTVKGEEKTVQTTPGVVQALGAPLSVGDTVTVTGGSPGVQLLVRAQQGPFVVEARFDRLGREESGRAVLEIGEGAEGPVLRVAGRPPVERRILEIESPPSVLQR